MENHHGVIMNIHTLKRRLKKYGLKRKRVPVDEETVRSLVRVEMANSGEQSGYRSIWHTLRLVHKVHSPREMVAKFLRELDPAASQARRARKLTRRKYSTPGPNYCWHVDGQFNFLCLYFVYT